MSLRDHVSCLWNPVHNSQFNPEVWGSKFLRNVSISLQVYKTTVWKMKAVKTSKCNVWWQWANFIVYHTCTRFVCPCKHDVPCSQFANDSCRYYQALTADKRLPSDTWLVVGLTFFLKALFHYQLYKSRALFAYCLCILSCLTYSSNLKKFVILSPETSLHFSRDIRRYNSYYVILHSFRCENPKTNKQFPI
jgi:hypothetical protein